LDFGILGPLLVVGPDGPTMVRGSKRRGLLAYLLVHTGEAVSIDRVVEDLWAAESSSGARGTVQTYLSQLRKFFAESSGVTLETRPSGYVLEVPADQLDARRFERLCARAASETSPTARVTALDEALALWRGDPLGEFAGSEWADVEATRLQALRVQALRQRIDARLDLGQHAEGIPELERLVREHSLDEHFWAQLMLAYYRSGRQAHALRAYQRARSILADELGVEPGAEIRGLERRILDHDPDLMQTLPSEPCSPTAPTLPEGMLTFLLTDIEGSTALWDQDPEAMSKAIERYEEVVARTVEAQGGQIVKSRGEGDSTLSVFLRPSDAAAAAIELQKNLLAEEWPGGLRVPTRMALHTGEAHLRDGDYYGGTLNRAARIRTLADGGQILCSRPTRDLIADTAPDQMQLIELGTQELRGLQRSETIYAVLHPALGDAVPRARSIRAVPVNIPLPVRLAATDAPFFGREHECALLDIALAAVQADGTRRAIVVSGEPGIGKTTLTAHFAGTAHANGTVVLAGHCDEDLDIPYQPWTEALTQLVRHAPDSLLHAHVAARGGELIRLVPELARRVIAPSPTSSEPEAERYLLFGAVVDMLERVSQAAPVVLVLDDLHWADRPTLQLLRHVIGAEAPLQVLLVMAHRDTDIADDHPVVETLAALHREPGVERASLGGLDADALGALLETAAGHALGAGGEELRDALAVETDGNPYFVTEVLRHLVETGAIRQGDDGRWIATTGQAPLSFPTSVREVIARRVARLGGDARQMLTLGAVIGREFDLELLVQSSGSPEEVVLEAVEEALGSRLIGESGATVDRFTFAHAIVRNVIYGELPASRRVRLHRRVGDALERMLEGDPRGRLMELAHHFIEGAPAGRADAAAKYAAAAAAEAEACLAFDDAFDLCQRGLAALRAVEQGSSRTATAEECDLLFRLGRAQLLSGRDGGRETLLRAYGIAEELGDPDRMASAVLSVNRGFFSRMGRTDVQLVAAIERAIAARDPGTDAVTAELLAALASELVWAEDGDRRFGLSDDALAMARASGESRTVARVLLLRTMTISAPDTIVTRNTECHELLDLAEELQDPAIRLQSAFNRGGTALESGDIEAAIEMVERARSLARELRQPSVFWLANMMGTARRILEGALEQAEQDALETLRLGQAANQDAEARIFFTEQMLEIRRWQDRLTEMLPEFRDLAGVDGIDFGYALARYLYDAGEEEAAASCYAAIVERLRLPPRRDMLAGALLGNLAYLTARVGDGDLAASIYELLLPFGDAFPTTTVAKPVGWHHLGMLAMTMGRPELAEKHFEAALSLHERARAPLLTAETQLEWARSLVLSGEGHRTAHLLDAVRATAGRHGAHFLERCCVGLSSAGRTRADER
jgi:DNA-binding SARP family transcriptional activator/class 3 adenylate cyclase